MIMLKVFALFAVLSTMTISCTKKAEEAPATPEASAPVEAEMPAEAAPAEAAPAEAAPAEGHGEGH